MKNILIFIMLTIILHANVSLNYSKTHWWESNDYNLPAIPSNNISEYIETLVDWSNDYEFYLEWQDGKPHNVVLSADIARKYIYNPINIVLDKDITLQKYNLNINKYSVAAAMRDIIFLQTLQNSIRDWKKKYIDQLSHNGVILPEAYNLASIIYKIYENYVSTKGFSNRATNPILNTLVTISLSEFYKIYENNDDNTWLELESDKIIKKVSKYNNNYELDYTDSLMFFNTILNESSEKFIEKKSFELLKFIYGKFFGISQESVSWIFKPIEYFYNTMENIDGTLKKTSQGYHLIYYYYLSKNYINKSDEFLNENGRIKDFYELFESFCMDTDDGSDPVISGLCSDNNKARYTSLYTTDKELETAYGVANLFLIVDGLNIEKIKHELVSRVKFMDYMAHNFYVIHTKQSANKYKITLPNNILSDTEHGNIINVNYNISNNNIFKKYPNAVKNKITISDYNITKSFTFDMQEYNATKRDIILNISLTYKDGFQKRTKLKLEYEPIVKTITINSIPNIFSIKSIPITITYCGDTAKDIVFYYKKFNAQNWLSQKYKLTTSSNKNGDCKTHNIKVDGLNIYHNIGYSKLDIKFKVGNKTTSIMHNILPNPNDVDQDGMKDKWELKYFHDLSRTKFGDEDGDGLTNYQEYLNQTDPTKAGIAGIYRNVEIKPYKINNKTIYKIRLTNTIWANVNITNGYIHSIGDVAIKGNLNILGGILDLNGSTLTVEGDLIHSGGALKVNNGKLIVKGNYRLQHKKDNGDYTYSYGGIDMNSANDYILVYGDFIIDTTNYSGGGSVGGISYHVGFSAGTLEIKGNFIQKGIDYARANFNARGTHKVILSGNKKQIVKFGSPGGGNYKSHFNILEITNKSDDGVEFDSRVVVTKEFNIKTCKHITNLDKVTYGSLNTSEKCKQNHDPVIIIDNNFTINEDEKGIFDFKVFDEDGDNVSVIVKNKPTYGKISITKNKILYLPNENYNGKDSFTLSFNDGSGGIIEKSISVKIISINDAPTIYGKPIKNIRVKQHYYFKPSVLDVDDKIFKYHIINKPSWLTFNENTGELKGNPTKKDIGIYRNIKISVKDLHKAEASLSKFTITVIDNSDTDHDGIPDNIEKSLGLNPNKIDTDGDGISDSQEVGSNYNNPIDTDGDGTIDALDDDSDNDGISDKNEIKYGLNPTDPSDATQDADGDGVSNIDEINAGTNPTVNNNLTWQKASKICQEKGKRLPTIEELRYDLQYKIPRKYVLDSTANDGYWSNTPSDKNHNAIYIVYGNSYYEWASVGINDKYKFYCVDSNYKDTIEQTDSDGDGIIDKFDNVAEPNKIATEHNNSKSFLAEVEDDKKIVLGDFAKELGEQKISIEPDKLPQDKKLKIKEVFDFKVEGVDVSNSTLIVLPLREEIPKNAIYVKFNTNSKTWREFAVDSKNKIYSAKSNIAGECPIVGSSEYIEGLIEGNNCIELLIQDGGANDQDGIANGVIVDPSGIAQKVTSSEDNKNNSSNNNNSNNSNTNSSKDSSSSSNPIHKKNGNAIGIITYILPLVFILIVFRREKYKRNKA